jgi:hypothetical protein
MSLRNAVGVMALTLTAACGVPEDQQGAEDQTGAPSDNISPDEGVSDSDTAQTESALIVGKSYGFILSTSNTVTWNASPAFNMGRRQWVRTCFHITHEIVSGAHWSLIHNGHSYANGEFSPFHLNPCSGWHNVGPVAAGSHVNMAYDHLVVTKGTLAGTAIIQAHF